MFSKKTEGFSPNFASRSKPFAIRTNNFSTLKEGMEKSTMRSRVMQKTFTNVDLHLNTLTK